MKDNLTSLVFGLILGIIIGASAGYIYSEKQKEVGIKINIGRE